MIIINRHGLYLPTPTGLKKVTSLTELAKKVGGKKLKAFVGPSLSYLENLTLPASKTLNEANIEVELATKIPTDLTQGAWTTETVNKDDDKRQLLAFALELDFFQEFKDLLAEQNITISEYSSLALAVASLAPDESPFLTIFIQSDIYFLVARVNGQIFIHHVDQLNDLKLDLANFISQLEQTNQIKIEKLYSYSDRNLGSLELEIIDLPINFSKLKASCSVDFKNHTKTNLITKKSSEPLKSDRSQLPKLLGLFALAVVALSSVWWWRIGSKTSQPINPPEPTPSPVVIPSPTLEPINPADIQLTVYNDTTTTGYAAQIAEDLEEAGYTNTKTGNAPDNDFTQNTIVTSNNLLANTVISLLADLNLTQVPEASTSSSASPSAMIYLVVPKSN